MNPINLLVTDKKEIERLRKLQRRTFSFRYIGWDDDFDREFDKHSEWFCSYHKKSKKIQGFCRVTYKNTVDKIPIELGHSALSPSIVNICCEINNFVYTNKFQALQLMSKVLSHIYKKDIELVYCLVDTTNHIAYRLNTETFLFIPTNKEVIFDSIFHKESMHKVTWSVLVQNKKARKSSIASVINNIDNTRS